MCRHHALFLRARYFSLCPFSSHLHEVPSAVKLFPHSHAGQSLTPLSAPLSSAQEQSLHQSHGSLLLTFSLVITKTPSTTVIHHYLWLTFTPPEPINRKSLSLAKLVARLWALKEVWGTQKTFSIRTVRASHPAHCSRQITS